jgi:hypothetical protein
VRIIGIIDLVASDERKKKLFYIRKAKVFILLSIINPKEDNILKRKF